MKKNEKQTQQASEQQRGKKRSKSRQLSWNSAHSPKILENELSACVHDKGALKKGIHACKIILDVPSSGTPFERDFPPNGLFR